LTDRSSSAGTGVTPNRRKVLAVASGGGHWLELCRLLPAFDGMDVAFVSVNPIYAHQVQGHRFYAIRDVSRKDWWTAAIIVPQLTRIILKERPQVVITTGSAPALLCLTLARVLVRAKTIWIDSIANVEKLSSSGSMAGRVADVWLTQWPALQAENGPAYWGAIL
jgi:UDP-N-acetylglucosamine:LPS N-acetylglucosamine transferase